MPFGSGPLAQVAVKLGSMVEKDLILSITGFLEPPSCEVVMVLELIEENVRASLYLGKVFVLRMFRIWQRSL